MPKHITCYEDSEGNLHRRPIDAYRADLVRWLAEDGALNRASAEKLADRIIGNIGDVQAMLKGLRAHVADEATPLVLAA